MSKNPKFDEAAFSKDKKTFKRIELETLNELKKSDEKMYTKTYYNYLYCPECHKPQLSLIFNNKTNNYFLRGYPKQQHTDTCHKGFDSLSNTTFNNFLSTEESYEFIHNKLKRIIDKLFRNVSLNENPFLIKVINKKCSEEMIKNEDLRERKNIYQIPHKSITAPFDEDDFNCFKLFYGNVDIMLIEKTGKTETDKFYILKLFRKNSNYILCSLSMNIFVAKYFRLTYRISLNERINNVYISFAAVLREKRGYKNGGLIHSDLCVIEKV